MHADALAKLGNDLWHWLDARGVAPKLRDHWAPELALWAYSAKDDELATDAVTVYYEVASEFAHSDSEINATIPRLAQRAIASIDFLDAAFNGRVESFVQACRGSGNARRICNALGIPLDEIETARGDVIIATASLREALGRFLRLWVSFAPHLQRCGVTDRAKDPVLTYFDWRLSRAGWDHDEIIEADGSYKNRSAGDSKENEPHHRTAALKALKKRIARLEEFMASR